MTMFMNSKSKHSFFAFFFFKNLVRKDKWIGRLLLFFYLRRLVIRQTLSELPGFSREHGGIIRYKHKILFLFIHCFLPSIVAVELMQVLVLRRSFSSEQNFRILVGSWWRVDQDGHFIECSGKRCDSRSNVKNTGKSCLFQISLPGH